MNSHETHIAENILELVKDLSQDAKRDLINKLTHSLDNLDQDPNSKDSWKELFGAWESEQSAEEIIDDIRSSRQSSRKIEEF